MRRAFVFTLICCLLVASASVVALPLSPQSSSSPASTPTTAPAQSSPVLTLPITQSGQSSIQTPAVLAVGTGQSNFTDPNVRVTSAVHIQSGESRVSLTTHSVQARLSEAETEAERRTILSNATSTLLEQANHVFDDSQQYREQYRTGPLTATEYSARLAEIHARADSLYSLSTFIKGQVDEQSLIYQRATRAQAQLEMYRGPVSKRLAESIQGDDSLDRVYIRAGPNGTAISTINDGMYIREATDRSGYDAETGSIPDSKILLSNLQKWYPHVMSQSPGIGFVPIPISTPRHVYDLTITHSGGAINALVDTSTNASYQEVQRLQLSALNTTTTERVQTADYVLAVGQTFSGGPLYINVTTQSGQPVDATVRVDNETVGRTGADGDMWTVEPSGDFTVEASPTGA